MSKDFLEAETLEKFKIYFLEIYPDLFLSRKKISSNLLNQSAFSDIKNYLSGHIKSNDLEKEEKILEENFFQLKDDKLNLIC